MGTVLLIRPNYDNSTIITSEWAEEIVKHAKKRGHKVIDLYGNLAKPNKFLQAIEDANPKLIIHYGHGKDDALLGQNAIPLISLESIHLMKGRFIYTVSCNSGKILAKEFVRVGGVFYYGYGDRFLFSAYRHELFKECVNAGAKALLDGKTGRESVNIVDQCFENKIRNLIQKEIDIVQQGLQLLDGANLPKPAEPLRSMLRTAYNLRLKSLQYEKDNLHTKQREKIGPKILQAFKYIESAEKLKLKIIIPDGEYEEFVSNMLSYARRYWISHCMRCQTINARTSHYCIKCKKFLLYSKTDLEIDRASTSPFNDFIAKRTKK